MFDGHRHFNSGDMTFVCHVISQDHKIKGSYDFIFSNHLSQITILLSFAAIGTVEMGIH